MRGDDLPAARRAHLQEVICIRCTKLEIRRAAKKRAGFRQDFRQGCCALERGSRSVLPRTRERREHCGSAHKLVQQSAGIGAESAPARVARGLAVDDFFAHARETRMQPVPHGHGYAASSSLRKPASAAQGTRPPLAASSFSVAPRVAIRRPSANAAGLGARSESRDGRNGATESHDGPDDRRDPNAAAASVCSVAAKRSGRAQR